MLDKHFKMKIPNNLLVVSLVCILRMKPACEELMFALICVSHKPLKMCALHSVPWVPAVLARVTWPCGLYL